MNFFFNNMLPKASGKTCVLMGKEGDKFIS